MRQTVVGLSGGMDSTTLLSLLINDAQDDVIHCCVFNYGSQHNQFEGRAAMNVMDYFHEMSPTPIREHYFDIAPVMAQFSSALLLSSGQEIPEGHYDAETMRQTVVPGRNLIFASIMAGLAESVGAQRVALGVHQGDHHIYPDCRTEFIKALDTTLYLSSDRKVEVYCPFLKEDKASILRIGYDTRILTPYHLTRTCYKNQELSCGRCGSCTERLEAFTKVNLIDPIEYELP